MKFNKEIKGFTEYYQMPAQKKKKRVLKKEQQEINLKEENENNNNLDINKNYFLPKDQWADDKFDEFTMKCSSKDQFEANS